MKLTALVRTRVAALAVVASAALGAALPAAAAPSVQLTKGATEVALYASFVDALGSLGVTPGSVLPGSLIPTTNSAKVAFPIPTGELDAAGPKLEILHSGGLTLTAGGTRVALTSFIIENLSGQLRLTGVVKANDTIVGRIPLFRIVLTQAPEVIPSSGGAAHLSIKGARLTLTETAANALNGVFGVTAFTKGFPIGVARVSATVRDLDSH
jgi:hypothetical protein